MPSAALIIFSLLLAVACGGSATPPPTPNLQATMEALVRETLVGLLAEMATPAPDYWPSLADFTALAYNRIDRIFQDSSQGGFWKTKERIEERYVGHVSVFVAAECLAGRELSFDGFRSFLDETYLLQRPSDQVALLKLEAERVVATLVGIANSKPGPESFDLEDDCTRPYLYPRSASEADLAIELVNAIRPFREIRPMFAPGVERFYLEQSYRWLDPSFGGDMPFLSWLCEVEFAMEERRCEVR